jgi:predicted HicB family RNase H-like nuclease
MTIHSPVEDWSLQSVQDLRFELKRRKLPTTGKKEVLVARLVQDDSSVQDLQRDQQHNVDDIVAALQELGNEPTDEALRRLEHEVDDLLSDNSSLAAQRNISLSVDYNEMTMSQLKEELRRRGLPLSGKKTVLVERLQGVLNQ